MNALVRFTGGSAGTHIPPKNETPPEASRLIRRGVHIQIINITQST